MPGDPSKALASMGIYIFNADYLFKLLEEDKNTPDSSHDFGKDIIPQLTAQKLSGRIRLISLVSPQC